MAWFAVRSVIRFDATFEERIVLFSASDAETALRRAHAESLEYVSDLGSGEVLDLQQSFELATEDISDSTEVFSLMRSSGLGAADYLTTHFDVGGEHQQSARLT